MNTGYRIRKMKASELSIAVDWAKAEGWNPGLHDATTFYAADPNGFFIGELNGEAICVANAVNYDNRYSFFGLYIVKKGYRHQGYGIEMTKHCLAYAGNRNSGLDGVLENIPIYERTGYHFYYKNIRYQHMGLPSSMDDAHIQPLTSIPFEDIVEYDRTCFFSSRDRFLKQWISQPDAIALGYIDNGKLLGFGVCRQCYTGYKIGPLFADNSEIAEKLFLALQNNKPNSPVFIDIPETNIIGQMLVSKYKMQNVFATARMYTQELPALDYQKIVGVTTFEMG